MSQWLRDRPWIGYGLGMAWVALTYWFVARSESMDTVVLELPMIMAGFLIAGRLLSTELSLKLLGGLPLRPQDIVHGQVLVASKWAALSLVPLLSILWIAHAFGLSPNARSLQIQDVVWAVLIFLLTLFFTLALGLSTNLRYRGLSAYRRRVIMGQAALLLHSHWVLESLSADGEGRHTAFLEVCTLAALVLLCAWTLGAQLRAGLATVKSPMWDIQEQYRTWLWLPAVLVLPPLQLSGIGNLKALIYCVLLVHLYLSFLETSKSRRASVLRWLDIALFIGLLQADGALWMQDVTIEAALGIQLLAVVVWWGLQNLGEGRGSRQPAETTAQPGVPALADPGIPALDDRGRQYPQIDIASHRRQRLVQRTPVDRSTHLVRSACRYFFNFPIQTGRTASVLIPAAVGALIMSPFIVWWSPFASFVPLAALFIAAVFDRLQRTVVGHPLISTLPMTHEEARRSLLPSSARLVLPILSGLFALQLLSLFMNEGTSRGFGLWLTCLSSCVLIGVMWIFGASISSPRQAGLHGLSKAWKVAGSFQITLASSCLLLADDMAQLSPSHQLWVHGLIWGTLLSTAWFAWRTQAGARSTGMGVAPRRYAGLIQPDMTIDTHWLALLFLSLFLYSPDGAVGGIGTYVTLIALMALALHPADVVRRTRTETIVRWSALGFVALVAWFVVRSFVWPVDSDLDRLHEYLFVLVACTFLGMGREARRLNKANRSEGRSGVPRITGRMDG